MAVRPILTHPNPLLRQKSKHVRKVDDSIRGLIDDMMETMRQGQGVGLAAPQVGVLFRVIVIEIPGEAVLALVNPQIARRSGERVVEEGCLCIPGYRAKLKRSAKVTVKGLDRYGDEVRVRGEGLLAQVLEHETDHLNGILYIDHLESTADLHKVGEEPETPEI